MKPSAPQSIALPEEIASAADDILSSWRVFGVSTIGVLLRSALISVAELACPQESSATV
jgi:hypothetical protein